MGELIPFSSNITMVLMAVVIAIGVLSCIHNYYILTLSFIISLIGARLASYYYSFDYHIYAMLISLLLLIGFKNYRLISLAYIPRIIIALVVEKDSHNEHLNLVLLLNEFLLIVQLLLWISILRNDNGGNRSTNSDYNSRYNSSSILARCRQLPVKMFRVYNKAVQKKGINK